MIWTILTIIAIGVAIVLSVFAIHSVVEFVCHCGDAGKFIFAKAFGPARCVENDSPMKWEEWVYRNVSDPVNRFLRKLFTFRR